MPTYEDALAYLGIDYDDDVIIRKNVIRALNTANETLKGAVGEDVWELLTDSSRAKELTLIYLDDLYSDKGVVSAKVTGSTRRMVQTMELQLKMELRKLREGALA